MDSQGCCFIKQTKKCFQRTPGVKDEDILIFNHIFNMGFISRCAARKSATALFKQFSLTNLCL